MTRQRGEVRGVTRQRGVLYGMGAIVAVLLAVLAVVVSGGSGGGPSSATPVTGAYVPPPSTSSTTTAPSTTAALPPTTATAPPTLPATDTPVSAAGSVLVPPRAPDIRTEDAPNDCRSLADQGWQPLDCQTATTAKGQLTYMIEVSPSPSYVSTRAYVFRPTASGAEQVVLETIDDAGNRYDSGETEAAIAPVGAFGTPMIVMGFPQANGSLTSVEVVEWPGVVAFHESLNGGVVQSAPGQLDTWARTGAGAYVHDRIEQGASGWHIIGEQAVAEDLVPDVSILA